LKTKDNLDINKSFFWNQKYTNNQDKWDLNKPTPILKNRSISFDTNNKLKICIPGCGKGHDALYLASIGHDVYAIDFSSNALTYLKDNNIYSNLHIIESDFFTLPEKFYNKFDVLFEYTFFCAINVSRREEYLKMCNYLLKSGGLFFGIIFPISEVSDQNSPPFKVDLPIFENLFSKHFTLSKKEFSNLSIEPRKHNEIIYEFIKK
tara:strand:+ start:1071 stop:1688 length:618 start_codon:yes stop_codon:yes gene_type:complete